MKGIILRWIINALVILLLGQLIRGVYVDSFVGALIAAAVLGILNALLRPILILLTLPFTILTLGLFIFLINGFMLYIVGSIVKGFHVEGFWASVIAAFILSMVSWISNIFINENARIEVISRR